MLRYAMFTNEYGCDFRRTLLIYVRVVSSQIRLSVCEEGPRQAAAPPSTLFAAAAAEFICHEKNIHVYTNVKDRRAARKE